LSVIILECFGYGILFFLLVKMGFISLAKSEYVSEKQVSRGRKSIGSGVWHLPTVFQRKTSHKL